MSYSDGSSDLEWKRQHKKKTKQEHTPNNKQKYFQKFCDKWIRVFSPWLARCDDDINKPFCRACQCRLDCNRCHLQRHERTTKHARNLEILLNKGEGAARQNLSIRQERSKYYQQRKKANSSLNSSQDASDVGMETNDDLLDECDPDSEANFQFVQTETPTGDQFNEESAIKQEHTSDYGHDPLPIVGTSRNQGNSRNTSLRTPKKSIKKERVKLLMQIQKDKNDLMDSFKELMGGSFQQSPIKDRNHVDLFFDSVSSSVKALSPKLIAEMKMRTSQLICEMELRALTENDANAVGGQSLVVTSEAGAVTPSYIINHQSIIQHQADGADYELS